MKWIPLLILISILEAPVFGQEDLLVVLNKDEATAWLIDPSTLEVAAKIHVGDGPHEAAVSPDGRTAVVCNYGGRSEGNSLSVIDVPGREVVKTIQLGSYTRPHGIQYFADGRHVLVTSETTGKLVKVDIEESEVVSVYDSGGDPHMVLLNRTGSRAFSTSIGTGILGITELGADENSVTVVETGSGTEAIALDEKRGKVWIAQNRSNLVKVVDLRTMEVVEEIDCGFFPIRLALAQGGKTVIASCMVSGDLALFDAEENSLKRRVGMGELVLQESDWKGKSEEELQPVIDRVIAGGPRPIGLLPAPDGYLYVANRGLNHIAVVDMENWEVIRRIPTGEGPDGMAWSRIE